MEIKEVIDQIKKELYGHEKRISELENSIKTRESEPAGQIESAGGAQRLAKKLNISEEKIREIFDFENETLTLLKVIGDNPKEKTQNASLLVLLGYKYCLNKNEIFSQEIRRIVGENGIPLENFATYLNELVPSSVRRKGKPRSPKTTYRLMPYGESRAKELIKKLCEI